MILQSGVIPYRMKNGEVEVLLITSSSGKRWIIPKGWITPWLTAADSAAKEAWEEAGIKGLVTEPAIGFYKTRKWGYPCQVEVFLMIVEAEFDDYPEAKRRGRQWMSLAKAMKQVREADLKLLLEQLDNSLDVMLN
jgi:8-oxo-dGTP pyrophosphatase MutT (NUDIX family)